MESVNLLQYPASMNEMLFISSFFANLMSSADGLDRDVTQFTRMFSANGNIHKQLTLARVSVLFLSVLFAMSFAKKMEKQQMLKQTSSWVELAFASLVVCYHFDTVSLKHKKKLRKTTSENAEETTSGASPKIKNKTKRQQHNGKKKIYSKIERKTSRGDS